MSHPKSKRLRMMHRRLMQMNEENRRANEQNRELIDRIIELEQSEVKLKNDNQSLISRIMDMQFELSRTKHKSRKLNASLMTILEAIGNASSAALEMRRELRVFQNDNRPLQLPRQFSPPILGPGSPSNRAQAMVNPMFEGYTLRNPKVALQRIRLNPQEIYLMKKRNKLSAINGLSPIQESSVVSPEMQPRDISNMDVFVNESESSADNEVLEGPYVRLNDVFNNSSWLVINNSHEEVLRGIEPSTSVGTTEKIDPQNLKTLKENEQPAMSDLSKIKIEPSTSDISESENCIDASSEVTISESRESPERDYVARRRGDKTKSTNSSSTTLTPSGSIKAESPMRQSNRKRKPRDIFTPEREEKNQGENSSSSISSVPLSSERSRRKRNVVNYKEESLISKKRR